MKKRWLWPCDLCVQYSVGWSAHRSTLDLIAGEWKYGGNKGKGLKEWSGTTTDDSVALLKTFDFSVLKYDPQNNLTWEITYPKRPLSSRSGGLVAGHPWTTYNGVKAHQGHQTLKSSISFLHTGFIFGNILRITGWLPVATNVTWGYVASLKEWIMFHQTTES